MTRAQDKVAIVTGGASGPGAAIARRLVAEGANVIATDTRAHGGRRLADELGCEFIEQDVTDAGQWERVIGEVESLHGALHILINGAGIERCFERMNLEILDWQAVHRANVEGVFLGCRAAIPALRRAGGGSIINLSPTPGSSPTPELAAHGASQAAVLYLTQAIALHGVQAGSKIRCNSVHLAMVMTSLMARCAAHRARAFGAATEQVMDELKSQRAQHDAQTWDDVAAAALFLVSDEAKHITGHALVVDGGGALALAGASGTQSERIEGERDVPLRHVVRGAGWIA